MSVFKKLTSAVSSVTGPSGERDPEFEEQRERFEKHEKHLHGLKKAVKKHAENFKCLVGPLGVVGEDMNNFYAGTEQGERFKECMLTIESAIKEFTSVHSNVEESIDAELKRLGQIRKEINDRDKIKAEMEKLGKEVAKGHKDAAKQRENEAKYQVAKDLYEKKNPQLTDELRHLWLDRVSHFEPQFTAIVRSQTTLWQTAKRAAEELQEIASRPPPPANVN